jgi:hypothetical protein
MSGPRSRWISGLVDGISLLYASNKRGTTSGAQFGESDHLFRTKPTSRFAPSMGRNTHVELARGLRPEEGACRNPPGAGKGATADGAVEGFHGPVVGAVLRLRPYGRRCTRVRIAPQGSSR